MFKNRVKEYREREGITQVELSRRTLIAAPNLSDIERGRRLAWERAKKSISKALKTNAKELFPEE